MSVAEQSRIALPEAFVSSVKAIFGDQFTESHGVREHHGNDESPYPAMLPDAVVYAKSTEDVVQFLTLANQYKVPVIPYGAGTSLEGHILAKHGGVSLDLSQMDKILSINPEDLTATVQTGVTRKQLNHEIKDTGLFFPIDPGANATIGGMVSTRASGTNAVRYGSMRENTLTLTVVLADGRVIKTGTRAKKSAAGYDLTRLFVGSEGTLGVVTEVSVKLYPLPEAISAAICSFDTLEDAVNTVIQTIQMGVNIARVELMDPNCVKAVNAYDKLTLPEKPLLVFEFMGSETGVKEQAEIIQELANDNGATGFEWATKPEDRTRLWNARHNAFFAISQLRPGASLMSTDSCVPVSQLAQCILDTKADADAHGLTYVMLGHVGDGNFHTQILVDPHDPKDMALAEGVNERMVARVIAAGGTCTGEHGVGLHKIDFLVQEHGENAIDVMRTIKHSLDPNNILNPGKVIRW